MIRLDNPIHEAAARALLRLVPDGDCWIWPGGTAGSVIQYGTIRLRKPRRNAYVHRVLYEVLVGSIPEGLTLDHLCRRPLCANPAHLEPVPIRENILRGTSWFAECARKTHCKRGHEFTAENTYRDPKRGTRACVTCQRARDSGRSR